MSAPTDTAPPVEDPELPIVEPEPEPETEPEEPEPLYGGAPTFTYRPQGGGAPIVFPSADVLWDNVDGVKPITFLWRVRKLNEPYQTFAFMERAKIPDEMAERALDLPDDERKELFRQWFAGVTEPPEAGLPPES